MWLVPEAAALSQWDSMLGSGVRRAGANHAIEGGRAMARKFAASGRPLISRLWSVGGVGGT